MEKLRNQRGFTLMELMVVIVIVAILATVAVPLYINYVKDAQRTEAKGAIGAIITAQQVYYQRESGSGYAEYDFLKAEKYVDVTEAELKWKFETEYANETTYKIIATPIGPDPDPSLIVTYTYDRTTGGVWDPR